VNADELAQRLELLMAGPDATRKDIAAELRKWQSGWSPVLYGTSNTLSPVPYSVWLSSEGAAEPELTAEQKKGYREQFAAEKQCVHCGGLHLRACPRVRRIVWRNKEEPSEIEYWPAGKWPEGDIVFPEDVYDDD
jgi:hypothetical protein